jgi:hypothetical protein
MDIEGRTSPKRVRDDDDDYDELQKISRIYDNDEVQADDDDIDDDDGVRINNDEDNLSLNEKLDTLDNKYTDASNTIDILNTLKSYNTNTYDNDNDNDDNNDDNDIIL